MITNVNDLTSFKWGTVTGNSPLQIKLDGDSSPLALIPDSLVDPLSLSLGDRVRVELSLRKVVVHGVANGSTSSFAGEVRMTAAAVAPNGWLLCRGQSLLRSAYPRLFTAIGTVYGAVDSTHFSLPAAQGRVAVGVDPAQTEFNALGKTGGAKTHSHPLSSAGQAQVAIAVSSPGVRMNRVNSDSYPINFSAGPAGVGDSGSVGSGAALAGRTDSEATLPPYISFNYIIKT